MGGSAWGFDGRRLLRRGCWGRSWGCGLVRGVWRLLRSALDWVEVDEQIDGRGFGACEKGGRFAEFWSGGVVGRHLPRRSLFQPLRMWVMWRAEVLLSWEISGEYSWVVGGRQSMM